jgi:hypothetical protein
MRTTLSIAAAAALAPANLHGQGSVFFNNLPRSAVTNSEIGQRVVEGPTFAVALYYLPANGLDPNEPPPSTADFDQTRITLDPSIGFSAPGLFAGGIRIAPTSYWGGPGWFQVRVWETAFGTTYEQARDNPVPQNGRLALVGTSNIIRVWTGWPPSSEPNPVPPGSLVNSGLQGFSLYPVPEPSALLLFLLGAWGLGRLWRRA